jgi:hypothetical protein
VLLRFFSRLELPTVAWHTFVRPICGHVSIKGIKLFIHFTLYQGDDTSLWILHGLHKESEISEEGSKSMLSTAKDREQIEYLINRYKETVGNLVDLRTQIWDKLDTDAEYTASVTTRLSDITEKLAAAITKTESWYSEAWSYPRTRNYRVSIVRHPG